jgi:hypothetical protein
MNGVCMCPGGGSFLCAVTIASRWIPYQGPPRAPRQ